MWPYNGCKRWVELGVLQQYRFWKDKINQQVIPSTNKQIKFKHQFLVVLAFKFMLTVTFYWDAFFGYKKPKHVFPCLYKLHREKKYKNDLCLLCCNTAVISNINKSLHRAIDFKMFNQLQSFLCRICSKPYKVEDQKVCCFNEILVLCICCNYFVGLLDYHQNKYMKQYIRLSFTQATLVYQ